MSTEQTSGSTGHEAERELVLSAERLQHSVVRVPRERVRISKRITTEVRTLEVPVRVEQLVIRHEPVSESDQPGAGEHAEQGGDLVLTLHEEVPVVSLRVQPTERVRLSVREVAGRQTISEVLRHEEIDVDESPRTP